MNRRGFIAALAALVPASLLPMPKPEPKYEHKVVRSPEITYLKDDLVWHDGEGGLVSMREAGEAFGESFSMSKGLMSIEGILGRKGT